MVESKKAADEFIETYFNRRGKRLRERDPSIIREDLFKDIVEDLERVQPLVKTYDEQFKLFQRKPSDASALATVLIDAIADARHLYHMATEDLIKFCKHARCPFGDLCTFMHTCHFNRLLDAYEEFRTSRDRLKQIGPAEKHLFQEISKFETTINRLSESLWFIVSRRRIGIQIRKHHL